MNVILQIQVLLFKWLRHHEIRNLNQIRVACKGLMGSMKVNYNNYLYHFFFPLVRMGLVEFRGENKYSSSPDIMIFNKEREIATGINLSPKQVVYISSNYNDIQIDAFDIIRFKADKESIEMYCAQEGISFTDVCIYKTFAQFPSVKEVVEGFTAAFVDSNANYLLLDDHSWGKKKEDEQIGIFKLTDEEFGSRYFIDNYQKCFKIPDLQYNPDAVNIAECYQAILEGRNFLYYDDSKGELTCKGVNMPFLVDRILRIPSYWSISGVYMQGKQKKYTNISISDFRQLNRIFCNSIQNIHE